MKGSALLSAGLLVLALPLVPAQQDGATVETVEGGEPGIRVQVAGIDLTQADAPAQALHIDPAVPVPITFSIAPPAGTTWEVRTIVVGLAVSSGDPPDALSQVTEWNSTIPSGFTVYVNQTMSLDRVEKLGVGLFRMQVAVLDETGSDLYRQAFFVKVEGNPILTASGAAVSALTIATGYGLWQLALDLKEFWDARDRHRRQQAEKERRLKLGVVEKVIELHHEAERIERRGPIAWTATGLGLGAVALSWLQFLGYLAFNIIATVVTAMGVAAAFLTTALVMAALRRRWAAARTVRVPVQGMDPGPKPTEPPAQARR